MKLCEKCKTLSSLKILRTSKGEKVCAHIYQRRYYAANKEKAREYQRQYNKTHRKIGIGTGNSKTDWNKLYDEMILKIPQISFAPEKIQHWSPEKIIKNWDRINF